MKEITMDICFTIQVESEDDIDAKKLKAGLLRRMVFLTDDEWVEACGVVDVRQTEEAGS